MTSAEERERLSDAEERLERNTEWGRSPHKNKGSRAGASGAQTSGVGNSHAEVVVEFPEPGEDGRGAGIGTGEENGVLVACRTTVWINHSCLVCSLPEIPQRQLLMDSGAGTLKATVRVVVADQMSPKHASASLTFRDVPAQHMCSNVGTSVPADMHGWGGLATGTGGGDRARIGAQRNSGGRQPPPPDWGVVSEFGRGGPFPHGKQQACFKCCRSACIVDGRIQSWREKTRVHIPVLRQCVRAILRLHPERTCLGCASIMEPCINAGAR